MKQAIKAIKIFLDYGLWGEILIKVKDGEITLITKTIQEKTKRNDNEEL